MKILNFVDRLFKNVPSNAMFTSDVLVAVHFFQKLQLQSRQTAQDGSFCLIRSKYHVLWVCAQVLHEVCDTVF